MNHAARSSSNNNTNSELAFTQTSLREALAANRELQDKLLSELARIAGRKRDNRLEAERCIERSCAVVLAGETNESTLISDSPLTATGTESVTKQGSAETEEEAQDCDGSNDKKKATTQTKKKRKRSVNGDTDNVPTSDDINELLAGDSNSNSEINSDEPAQGDETGTAKVDTDEKSKRTWTTHLRRKFRYDPYRKWTPEYFIDPTGSRPKDNEDTIRRKKLMMKKRHRNSSSSPDQPQEEDEMVPDTFFHHTCQPFTPKEKALLDKWLLEDSNNNNKWIENGDGDNDDDSKLFYQQIAQKLRQEHHENLVARRKDKVILPTCVPRLAEDIRLYHQDRLASQYEFTKDESLAILEAFEEESSSAAAAAQGGAAVGENDGEESTELNHDVNEKGKRSQTTARPDWHKICDRVLEVHRRQQKNIDPDAANKVPPITPYHCMVHYKRKLRPQPDGSFTPEEDEFLLRYVAAMGPQFLWVQPEITDLASRLFPRKTSQRIFERTHFSQWHPLSKDTIWTKEEEMKLVLLMKIYSDTVTDSDDNSDGDGAKNGGGELPEEVLTKNKEKARIASEKAALRKAASHFHPYRQKYKVVKKWERSFSPRFSYKPFSKEEEAKLLAAVKSSAMTTPFSEIAKKHFPDRSSDQLYQRWIKIAAEKDIIKKYFVPSMMRQGLKRGLLSAASKSSAESNEEVANGERRHDDSTIQGSGALFDESDFVVEVLGNEEADGQD